MDDALTVARSQTAESQAARMIYSTAGLFTQFIKYVRIYSCRSGLKLQQIVIFKDCWKNLKPAYQNKPNQTLRP